MHRLHVLLNLTVLCFLVMCYCGFSKPISEEENKSLQLIHIVFRHGEKTNSRFATYPKDPYINETYFPFGVGELTNKGKKREYRLGKAFRERYDKFLGKFYHPNILEAWSSDTDRTKASLMLVLAGLFPPTSEDIWEDSLMWQPIPFNHQTMDRDKVFFGIVNCPNYKKEYYNYVQSRKMVEKFKEYKELFQFISEKTGWNVTTFKEIFQLYTGLKAEEEWGLDLPSWTKKVYPHPIRELAINEYSTVTATATLRRIVSGYLLKKIIEDSKSKITNEAYTRQKKIYLYSGHEINLAALLSTLDIFDTPHVPPYGSYIIFEVHKINDIYGIKIFYQDFRTREPQILKLPGCERFCEFNKFLSLVEEYLPTSESCGIDFVC